MALAEAVASTRSTKNLILLGDPNQLGQPTRAAHPEGTDHSALDHIIGGHSVMPNDQGVFLDVSYRMHPHVCSYISEQFYEGELESGGDAPARSIDGVHPGVHVTEVEHNGRRAWCPEEANQVTAIVTDLLGKTVIDPTSDTRTLGPNDILVVAPYNAAVHEIRQHLANAGHPDIAVGTVDKFQGQEAAVVIASLTASNGELAPRGIRFLLDPARINVAVSRAQVAAYLIHSRELPLSKPTTTDQVAQLSSLIAADM